MIPPPIASLLGELADRGLELVADGDVLCYCPAEAMTTDLAARVAKHKSEIIALLHPEAAARYTLRELLVMAQAGSEPADVPLIARAKIAFAGLGGLTLVSLTSKPSLCRPDDLPPAWREEFEERAGIMEFDGGMARDRAEAMALADTLARMHGAQQLVAS